MRIARALILCVEWNTIVQILRLYMFGLHVGILALVKRLHRADIVCVTYPPDDGSVDTGQPGLRNRSRLCE